MGRGKDSRSDRGRQDEGWNNVPNKPAKIQEKVDPSKLKISKVLYCYYMCIVLNVSLNARLTSIPCRLDPQAAPGQEGLETGAGAVRVLVKPIRKCPCRFVKMIKISIIPFCSHLRFLGTTCIEASQQIRHVL